MLQEDDGFSNRLLSIKREEVHACKKDDSGRGNKGKKRKYFTKFVHAKITCLQHTERQIKRRKRQKKGKRQTNRKIDRQTEEK
jgi:hypothetical protein